MHRPVALLLRRSRWPATRGTQFCPVRRWYSDGAQPVELAPGAAQSTTVATSESNSNGPSRNFSAKKIHQELSLNNLKAQIAKDQAWKTQTDFDSIDEWNKENARLAFKGAIKEADVSHAQVRLPCTKKTQGTRRDMNVYYHQLRDACTCHLCVDPKTKQRNFRLSDIPERIMPRRMRWLDDSHVDEEKVLEIQWATDVPGYDSSHVTRVSADEIGYPASYFFTKETRDRKQTLWNKSDMDEVQHWVSYNDYMENEDKFHETLNALSQYGLIFIKDIPDSRQMVEQLATRIGPLRNSFYGQTWDVRNDPKAKNVAYTNQNLGFHMDLLYMTDPPGYQLLHCLKNSCNGGESLFVDAHSAARDLDPSSWFVLSQSEVPYHYNHEDHYYRTTRPVIEVAQQVNMRRNQLIKHINYSPPFQGPFDVDKEQGKKWAQNTQRLVKALKKFTKNIEEPSRIFELKLNPGECVIFENRRVLHARRAFDTTSGERWLAGAYVDESDVNSKLFTTKRKAGVFNGSQRETDGCAL
jgi:alpha-ketoglutarate-dependent taurine dioxygenase